MTDIHLIADAVSVILTSQDHIVFRVDVCCDDHCEQKAATI